MLLGSFFVTVKILLPRRGGIPMREYVASSMIHATPEVVLVPGERMTWRGGMPLGLFTGTRTYRLTPDLQPSFARFADGLKWRVEGTP